MLIVKIDSAAVSRVDNLLISPLRRHRSRRQARLTRRCERCAVVPLRRGVARRVRSLAGDGPSSQLFVPNASMFDLVRSSFVPNAPPTSVMTEGPPFPSFPRRKIRSSIATAHGAAGRKKRHPKGGARMRTSCCVRLRRPICRRLEACRAEFALRVRSHNFSLP